MSILNYVQQNRMTSFQILTVTISLCVVMLDGFEVAIMAFAAPQIQEQMGLTPDILGYVLSASLFGMAVGSIVLTPLADRIGRRPLTLIMLIVIAIGMGLTVLAESPATLITWRVLTGLGIGGMMANLNALVSEYSSDKRRSTVIGIYAAGYPIGATIGGLVARPLIPEFGWHAIFIAGTALALLALVICFFALPESLDFLLERRPRGALEKINAILTKMNAPTISELPAVSLTAADRDHGAIHEVLSPPTLFRTLALWIGYALLTAAYYFANTWIPTILTNSSGDAQLGNTMGVVANFGGVLGCFVFAGLAIKFNGQKLLYWTLFAAAGAFLIFGTVFSNVPVAIAVGLLLGILTTAGIAGFYAVSPTVYTARARATGIGWMIGLGRLVSVVAPVVVGYILTAGADPEKIFLAFAIPLIIAGFAALSLGLKLGGARPDRTDSPDSSTLDPSPS